MKDRVWPHLVQVPGGCSPNFRLPGVAVPWLALAKVYRTGMTGKLAVLQEVSSSWIMGWMSAEVDSSATLVSS